jgi:CspA family cold shock protein
MPRGKVKWFSIEKGFGFLVPDDGGRDVFVHRSQVNGLGYDEALIENEEVEFEVEKGPKGLSAQDVTRLG